MDDVKEKQQPTLLIEIIETWVVNILQGANENAMNEGMWYLDNEAINQSAADHNLFLE